MFNIGDYVTNFGLIGKVVEFHHTGSLVLENSRVGRWIADPEKCQMYKEA